MVKCAKYTFPFFVLLSFLENEPLPYYSYLTFKLDTYAHQKRDFVKTDITYF